MANTLPREKQIAVLKCLVEGNSIRGTERITGVYRNTVCRLLERFGRACESWLDLSLCNLNLSHIELDEIWTFCGKKQGKLKGHEKHNPELGDQYLFLALDLDTKLIANFLVGKRTYETTRAFIEGLEKRLVRSPDTAGDNRPQISTDGWPSYPPAIARIFKGSARHGVLIKNYSNPEVGRYAPPNLKRTDRYSVRGIKQLWTICTSHIERCNLTIRTFMKRFTRLSLGFSKKLDNLTAAVALHIAHYNFCWRLREPGSSGMLRPTPAMSAGLVDTLWSLEDLYDAVMEHDHHERTIAKYRRLGERMRRE
jgi:IS1 family transposase